LGLPLRILVVEDSPEDAYLMLRELERCGFEPQEQIVTDEASMRQALSDSAWDVIVSDHALPAFDAFGAMALAKEFKLDIPFIIVSGTIQQEIAVEAMKSGAHDYLPKDNLARLAPAIRRELDEAQMRESRRVAERELAAVREELAQQLSDITRLHQLGVRLSMVHDLDSVAKEILDATTSLLMTDVGAFLLFEARAKILRPIAVRGTTLPDGSMPPAEGVSAAAVQACEVMSAGLDATDGRALLGTAARAAGCLSVYSIPLATGGSRVLGCIECYPRRTEPFSGRENRMIDLYTQQAAQVLDNVLLFEQALVANRLKDEFVAMVSHELRTPLTPILGATHMLRVQPDDPARRGYALDLIERNVRVQTGIIDDLLDMSRIVSGKLRLHLVPVDFKTVSEAAIDTVRNAADAKQISIESIIEPIEQEVIGDPDRVRQIMGNLLSNAVKFTPRQGRIQVHIRFQDGHAEIRVRDTGVGIAPDFLPYVFERFRQADSSSTRSHGGLGLGLAIVRQLVELHGGTVTAESDGPGTGALFIVRLPMREPQQQDRQLSA
jgi:signal transduction histidine kinase/CheY-like chemotaxis protein